MVKKKDGGYKEPKPYDPEKCLKCQKKFKKERGNKFNRLCPRCKNQSVVDVEYHSSNQSGEVVWVPTTNV